MIKIVLILLCTLAFAGDDEDDSTATVFGKVGDMNSRYVELEFSEAAIVVPRDSIEEDADLRPGKYVTATPTFMQMSKDRPESLSPYRKKSKYKKRINFNSKFGEDE